MLLRKPEAVNIEKSVMKKCICMEKDPMKEFIGCITPISKTRGEMQQKARHSANQKRRKSNEAFAGHGKYIPSRHRKTNAHDAILKIQDV